MPTVPSRNLEANIQYIRFCYKFDLPIPDEINNSLQKTICPLCNNKTLYILDGITYGSYWLACRKCLWAGDYFDLAAKKRNIDIYEVVHIASKEGLIYRINNESIFPLINKYLKYKTTVNEFKSFMENTKNIFPPIQLHPKTIAKWIYGPNKCDYDNWNYLATKGLVGWMHGTELKDFINAHSLKALVNENQHLVKITKIDTKIQYLILPLYMAPGGLIGFVFFNKQTPVIVPFHPDMGRESKIHAIKARQTMYWPDCWEHWDYQNMFISTFNDSLISKVCKQWYLSNKPPQFIFVPETFQSPVWMRAFWGDKTFCLIIQHNQLNIISQLPVHKCTVIDSQNVFAEIKLSDSLEVYNELLNKLQGKAIPVIRYLRNLAMDYNTQEIGWFVSENLPSEIIPEIERGMDRTTLAIFRKAVQNKKLPKIARLGYVNMIVNEKGISTPDEKVCDFYYELDVIYYIGNEAYVKGVCYFEDEEIEFVTNWKEFRKDPAGWLAEYLLRIGKGIAYYVPRWSINTLIVSLMLKKPNIVNGNRIFGWHGDRLILPNVTWFEGKAYYTPQILQKNQVSTRNSLWVKCPASNILPPLMASEGLQPSQRSLLVNLTSYNYLLWLIAIEIVDWIWRSKYGNFEEQKKLIITFKENVHFKNVIKFLQKIGFLIKTPDLLLSNYVSYWPNILYLKECKEEELREIDLFPHQIIIVPDNFVASWLAYAFDWRLFVYSGGVGHLHNLIYRGRYEILANFIMSWAVDAGYKAACEKPYTNYLDSVRQWYKYCTENLPLSMKKPAARFTRLVMKTNLCYSMSQALWNCIEKKEVESIKLVRLNEKEGRYVEIDYEKLFDELYDLGIQLPDFETLINDIKYNIYPTQLYVDNESKKVLLPILRLREILTSWPHNLIYKTETYGHMGSTKHDGKRTTRSREERQNRESTIGGLVERNYHELGIKLNNQ